MIERAVEAMRAGACNYLPKPFEPEALVAEVARWMLPAAAATEDDVIARDPASQHLLELALRVAASEATVLITGESGVGKEVVARFVHRRSARAGGPFVAVNCAAIPENLLEATLFGYEKGAFTGASAPHAGKFEQAQGGTLLLDEISEMPLALQAKLLRVLQEREVERVGGRKPIALDVRILATSNRELQAERSAARGPLLSTERVPAARAAPAQPPARHHSSGATGPTARRPGPCIYPLRCGRGWFDGLWLAG
jgi:two-component system response regulator FlrC